MLLKYFHTLRHLKPIQVYGRLWHRINHARPQLTEAPPLRRAAGRWISTAKRPPSLLGPQRFRFLNETHELEKPEDWNRVDWEKLWLYNLHYFDDLNAHGAEARTDWHRALISRWIAENQPGRGSGWEPYPLSLRIVNWIKWALAAHPFPGHAIHSLSVQARYLRRRLEYHLLGNHLFANAKALVFAGLLFEGPEAEGWLKKGLAILEQEIPEQVLGDGGHFELSPMYHSIILEDLLDLINLCRTYPGALPDPYRNTPKAWVEVTDRMRHWLRELSHPDGQIAFFNDATFGIAAALPDLEAYAARFGFPRLPPIEDGLLHLKDSGYVRIRRGPIYLLFDVGKVGPDYLPGHAHADTLSFELSWGAQRVICNSGTSCYGTGTQRLWERSTAAHSTVKVDSTDSSEVWGGFRVARRASVHGVRVWEDRESAWAEASHDGYRRLPDRPLHRRRIEVGSGVMCWWDEVTGKGRHEAKGYIPIHPDVSLHQVQQNVWRLDVPGTVRLELRAEGDVLLAVEEGCFAPEFGKVLKRRVLKWVWQGVLPVRVTFGIFEI
jgi:uncharacterized heparinase superfamily protein